jgi:tetratricopeptide (TPR) repeat protein/tRNA A-37 threonylcarbamoyl transferase component Bud32
VRDTEFLDSTNNTRLVTDGAAGWRMLDDICQLKPGKMVPGTRYELRKWVGEGGMGHVFEAVHVDIERFVALKVMKSRPEKALGLPELFLREARACAKVESRFVVKVMDFGELPDGRPFFVMELLGRETVHSALKEGPMQLGRALPILRQCCKALAAIHDAGLVHRDIKPKNVVLLQEDGRNDTIRVVDFGVATAIGSTPRTCGTVPYMAPEQIVGQTLDGRADIYALGCMAYDMLTRRPPFVGEYLQVLDAHVGEQAPPITALCPTLPAALDPILLRCLEKHPDQRWSSAHELEAALIELQCALGLITAWDDLPMPLVDETRRAALSHAMPRSRRRAGWVVPVALGMMLMLGTTMGLVIADRDDDGARAEAHAADEVTADSSADDNRIEALTNETRLAASKAYWVYPIGEDPKQATALHWIGVLESERGPVAERAKARASGLRAEIAETLVRLGDRYWGEDHGRSFALEYYAMALVFEPELSLDEERNPLTQVQLADRIARAERGEFNTAELRAAKALAVLADSDAQRRAERLAALVEDDGMLSLAATEQLSNLVGADEKPTDEQPAGVGEDATSLPDPSDRQPDKAAALVRQARAAAARGDRAGARRAFNEAIEADSRSIDALSGLAELHFEAGEYSKALGYASKASRLRPNDRNLLILLGDCELKTLRYASARDAYEDAGRRGHPQARGRLAKLDALAR